MYQLNQFDNLTENPNQFDSLTENPNQFDSLTENPNQFDNSTENPNQFYPSPNSPSFPIQQDQVILNNKDWLFNSYDYYSPISLVNTPTTITDISFLDIPNDLSFDTPLSTDFYGYTQLLNQSPIIDSIPLFDQSIYMQNHSPITSTESLLSFNNQITLQNSNYSEPYNLSREQLIHRVVQLELEKNKTDEELDYPHACLWNQCQAKAPTLEKLMVHICEAHIGSGKAIYYCDWKDCARNKKPFMKRHKMHNHMRTHTGERPFVCTIIGCNKSFSRPDSLSTHIKTHSDIRPYLCQVPNCEKAYFHSRSLRKHVKSTHLKSTMTPKKTKKTSVRRNQTPSVTIPIQLDSPFLYPFNHRF